MSYLDYVNESVRSPDQELEDLKRANGFTDADLAMNRLGKFGAVQISRLVEQVVRPLVKSFLITAGWLLLVIVSGWIISAGLHRDPPVHLLTGMGFTRSFMLFRGLYVVTLIRLGAVIMVINCVGGLVVAVMMTAVKTVGLVRDALAGKVAMCEGRVYASQEERRGCPWDALREAWTRVRQERPQTFRYAIGDLALEVGYEGFRALANGGHYKVYFAPQSRLLLSIEPASGPALAGNPL
jgi:hypothetical protein